MEDAAAAGAEREDALRREAMRAEEKLRAAEMAVADLASNAGDSTKPLLRQIEAMAAAAVSLLPSSAPYALRPAPSYFLMCSSPALEAGVMGVLDTMSHAGRLDNRRQRQKQRLAFFHAPSLQRQPVPLPGMLSVLHEDRCVPEPCGQNRHVAGIRALRRCLESKDV